MFLLAESYRGKYYLNEYGKVRLISNQEYTDCTMGNLSYFTRVILMNAKDFNVTELCLSIIKSLYDYTNIYDKEINELKIMDGSLM